MSSESCGAAMGGDGRLGELAAIIDSSNDAIIGKRLDGTITSWNRAAEELYGYSAEEAVGRPIDILAPPERRGEIADFLGRLGAGERIEQLQTVRVHKDETLLDIVLTISPIHDDAGQVVGASTIARDIGEQLAAAAALRRSEEDYRLLFERHPAPMFVYNPANLHLLAVNEAMVEAYGWTKDELLAMTIDEIWLAEEREDIRRVIAGVVPGSVRSLEARHITKDGRQLVVFVSGRGVPFEGQPARLVLAQDATERRRLEGELNRSEESYRHLFDQHPAPMFVFDPVSFRFLAVNEAMVDDYGWTQEEILAMTRDELWPPEERAALRLEVEQFEPGEVHEREWRHLRKDGSIVVVAIAARSIDFAGQHARLTLAQDITAQRRLEEELRQTQKMDAIGRLAGGIAHDFNNLLVVIRGNSHLLLKRLEGDVREYVEHIDAAAERAADLTRQLLSFSRQRVLRLEPVDLDDVVTETLALLQRSLGEDIVISADLDVAVGAVLADRSELSNAILNLAINARDAMSDGGTLDIQSAAAHVAEGETRGELPPGRYALLRITDSGIGMDEETRARAFDPFFTTKQEGTGLGLAAVYGVVRQSGGHIWVYSEPGLGTTFKLYFPLTGELPAIAEPDVGAGSLGGDETILVVEDTEMVRGLVASTLRAYGYEVLAAAGAEEALALVHEGEPRIDLLLTDVIMPGMNGRELADRLLALLPGLKVLFTSGYPADTILRLGIAESAAAYIEKPFLPDELARTIRGVLDRGQQP
jgi:PAS domain S-box-containing protein